MARNILAPWAEVVAGADTSITLDDLISRTDDAWTYELVDGRLVRMPPASGGDSWSAISLATALVTFVASRGLGRVTGADGEFVLSKPDEPLTSLAPDVAFVRTGRYPSPATPEYRRPWHIAPDLAVEIASPNQYRPELAEKARRYLEAGVLLLWIVWPKYRQVDVWRPGSHQPVATLADVDFLDGLDILPGFTFPVTDLFT